MSTLSSSSPGAAATSSASALQTVTALRYGSLALLGGYTVALCYRVGIVKQLLPRTLYNTIEHAVERIKSKTEPIGDAKRFALVRKHLTSTYGLASSGMVAVAAGVVAFWCSPHIPIAIPVTTTLVPALLLLVFPKRMMLPAARVGCFYLSWVSAGYAMGPIGFVAQDTLAVFVLLSGCTMTGLCVPLFLTRGMISYVVSAQVLSSALSIALVTAPKQSSDRSPFKGMKQQQGVQMVLNADINVLFTMQLFSNLGICALHTLPTMYRFISWTGPEGELAASADALSEAYAISAGWCYLGYRTVRWASRVLMRHVLSDSKAVGGKQNTWLAMSNYSVDVNRASGGISAVVMALWYVRAVSLLQKGDPAQTLSHVRDICARVSPMSMLLGSAAIRSGSA